MALKCQKCNKIIRVRQSLTCAKCKVHFHIDCANVSDKRYYLMENKATWKCGKCITAPRTPTAHHSKNPPDIYEDNITHRVKQVINVSIENSFQSLSASIDEDGDLDSSSTTPQRKLNRSCPDLDSCGRIDMDIMSQKLINLEEKLTIAENEIENLLSENYNLKDQIEKYKLKTKQLTELQSTPVSRPSTTRKKRKNLQRITLDLNDSVEAQPDHINSLTVGQTEECINSTTKKTMQQSPPSSPSNSAQLNHPIGKPKIHILGDEQVRGLSSLLKKTRTGEWNDIYDVASMIKSYAPCTEILSGLETLTQNLTKDDIFILSIGSHDKNPYLCFAELCKALYILRDYKVFLLSVQNNNYLNVNTLNGELQLLTKNYTNCKFINVNASANNNAYPKHSALDWICFKLNIEINYLKYNQYFIKNALKFRVKKNTTVDKTDTTKKGTIPYYFKILPKTSNAGLNCSRNQSNNDLFRSPKNT